MLSISPVTRLANVALGRVAQVAARAETFALGLQYRLTGETTGASMSSEAQDLVARHPLAYEPSPNAGFSPERKKQIARAMDIRGISG